MRRDGTAGPSRRQVLATGLLGLAAPAFGPTPAAATTPRGVTSWAPEPAATPSDVDNAVAFLRAADVAARTDAAAPRLLQSYTDEFGLFRTAFVEDTALAVLALLAAGDAYRHDAVALGEGLLAVAAHDPSGVAGRVRRAYSVAPYDFYDGTPQDGPLLLAGPRSNPATLFGLDDSDTGGAAWAGTALVRLAATTGDERYLQGARSVAAWLTSTLGSPGPLGGYVVGTDDAGTPHVQTSTAHNVDCFGFLNLLAALDDDPAWRTGADDARRFVESARAPGAQQLSAVSNDGTVIGDVLSMDAVARGLLVLPDVFVEPATVSSQMYSRSKDALTTDRPSADEPQAARSAFSGPPLSVVASSPGVPVYAPGAWVGATCQLALAAQTTWTTAPVDLVADLRDLPRQAQADATFRQSMDGRAVAPGSGLVAAWVRQDGTADLEEFQFKHVGTTAWFVLSELHANPFAVETLTST